MQSLIHQDSLFQHCCGPDPRLGKPCSPTTGEGYKDSQTGVSEALGSNCVSLVNSPPLSEPQFLHSAYFILNKTEA